MTRRSLSIERRSFLRISAIGTAGLLIGCGDDGGDPGPDAQSGADGSSSSDGAVADAPSGADAAAVCDDTVIMYDMNAQALYFDGTYGPLTGVILVDYIVAGASVTLDFWHGHGGNIHRFTLEPEHYQQLKDGLKVTIETSVVDDHTHLLFIDPNDPSYRVDGAQPVEVPNC